MDLILLIGIAASLLIGLALIWLLTRQSAGGEKKDEASPTRGNRRPEASDASIPRRAQIARNQRHRPRGSEAAPAQSSSAAQESDSDDGARENQKNPFAEEKMGTKKRAKLEAKAERQRQREAELQAREERKKRDAIVEEERRKEEQREEELERKREESERLVREDKERREHEEYLKLKQAFQVEEEGYDECDDDEKENLLQSFVAYIKENKVVVLEDLATHFKLKTQAAIDRIAELQEAGTLTGVIDDQGKFIYISNKELADVANFIRQRGRVSITELVESSNNLINLKPGVDSEVVTNA